MKRRPTNARLNILDGRFVFSQKQRGKWYTVSCTTVLRSIYPVMQKVSLWHVPVTPDLGFQLCDITVNTGIDV